MELVRIDIIFKTDEATELAVKKSADERAALNDTERAAVSRFSEAVELFKTDVIDGEEIVFKASSEDFTVQLQATAWRPGRDIFVIKSGSTSGSAQSTPSYG